MTDELRLILERDRSEFQPVVEQFAADHAALLRRYDLEPSPVRQERLQQFTRTWLDSLSALETGEFGVEGRLDALLLKRHLERMEVQHQRDAARRRQRMSALAPVLPLVELHEARRRHESPDPEACARVLSQVDAGIRMQLRVGEASGAEIPTDELLPAAHDLSLVRTALDAWKRHYCPYDPRMAWWLARPLESCLSALEEREAALTRLSAEGMSRSGASAGFHGRPLGRDALLEDLRFERIPYSPEELLCLADRELKWCESRLREASSELGFGGDTAAAVEAVKVRHEEPGGQPDRIVRLAQEAIDWVRRKDLLTVPSLATEVWRLEMMTAEEQKTSPFFLGGEVIKVSFPTVEMDDDAKRMSLRGNNIGFSRATVQHELIPGHHMQSFAGPRAFPHRRLFWTPFWVEGWTLHWEMLLWDRGFPSAPEERIGMLFWMRHRAARIRFSLQFHLGEMTADEAIDFLVQVAGHERACAEGEVRRSVGPDYPPLYQAAYLLGGLQVRRLAREAVNRGMSLKTFHDRFLWGGQMPVDLARVRILGAPLSSANEPWRFLDGSDDPSTARGGAL